MRLQAIIVRKWALEGRTTLEAHIRGNWSYDTQP
jgi:hypothetical protein